MDATITALTFKSAGDRDQAVLNIGELRAQAEHLPGFRAAYVVQTGERAAAMFTVHASAAGAGAASAQLRPAIGRAIGPHVTGASRRLTGGVLIPAHGEA